MKNLRESSRMRKRLLSFELLEDRTVLSPPGAGWQMLFEDNFDGSAINTANWTIGTGTRRDAINTASAVSVTGGTATLTTYTSGGTHYTGWLGSSSQFRATYGYYEANIKFTDSPGMWSAFWMQSPTMGNPIGNSAVAGSELDIVEHRAIDSGGADISNKLQSNLHWDGYGADHKSVGSGNYTNPGAQSLQGNFHLYAMEWSPTGYTMYLDGNQFWNNSNAISQRSEFIYLTSEVQNGSWAGSIPAGGYGSLASSTTTMVIDSVRVWQKPVQDVGDKSTPEDTPTAAIPVYITQRDNVSTTFTATSSNTNLVPGVALGGSGANRTATITPAADRTGYATITLQATTGPVSGNDTFNLAVNAGSTVNPGFDDSLTGWPSIYGGAMYYTTNQRSGTGALRIVATGGAEQTITGLSPNTTYTLGGYVRTTNSADTAYLGVKNYGGSQILAGTSSTSYVLKTLTFTTGATDTSATIFAYKASGANNAYFDDYYLFRSPTLPAIAAVTLFRNGISSAIPFTPGNVSSDASTYSITATSSNTTLLPNANIALGGSGNNRTITLVPAANQTGSATVTLTLTDVYGGSTTKTFTVSVIAPPTITSTTVNGGASQRSRITSIALGFASPVNAAAFGHPGAIVLTRPDGVIVQTASAAGRVNVSPTTGFASSITLTFDNASGALSSNSVEYNSLADGVWTLGGAAITTGQILKRFYGDVNLDGTVDATDFAALGSAWNTASAAFDFEGNGVVDANDLAQFGNRFGRTL